MRQRDFDDVGWRGAVEGMTRASEHAERAAPRWGSRALTFLCRYLVEHRGEEFIAPEVRAWAEANGLDAPASKYAWGGIFNSAHRLKLIHPTGYRQYGDSTTHTQPVRTWRGT